MALRGSGRSRDDPLELDDPEDSAEKSLRGAIRPSTQQSIRRAIGLIVDLTGDSDEEHAQPPPLPNASKAENAIPVTALSVLPILQSHLVLDKAPVSHRPSNQPAAESNVGERRPYDALQSLFGTADDSTPMDQETASPQHVPKVSSPTGSRPPQPHSPKPKSPKAHPNSQHPSTKTASVPPPEPIAHRPQQELLVQCSTTPKGSPSPPMHRKSMAVKSASNWPRRDPRPIKRLLSGLSQRESSRLGLPPQSGQTSRAEPTLQTQSASLVQPTLEVPSISQVELTQPNASETIESMIPLSTDNLQTAMALVNACLQRHLRGTYTDHAYRVKSVLRAQRFRLERKTSPIGNISGTLPSATPQSFMQKESPFKSLKPLNKAVGSKDKIYLTQELFPKARTKDNKVGATVTSYRSTAVKVPRYDEYVALNQNVLMENRNTLPCYPWLPDDVDVHDMEIDLPEIFKMKNPKSNDLAYTRRFYQSGLKSFLAELDIEWQDVLYWHLAPEEELKRINKKSPSPDSGDFEKFLLQRKPFWDPNFKLGQAKWTALLSAISQPSTAKLRLAALASVAFHGQTPFKLWYLARQSPFAQEILSQNHSGAIIGTNFTYESAVCRVCQMYVLNFLVSEVAKCIPRHNCPHHGELRQYSRDHPWEGEHQARLEGYEDGSSDSDSEKIINYRRVANTHALPIYSGPVSSNGRIPTPPPDQFNAKWWKEHPVSAAKWWEKHSLAADWKRRLPFFPCKHEGTCEQAQCRCYRTETPCEKTCACAASCTRRFRGCSCAIEGKDNPGKLPLCQTSQCPCWRMNRECDADLCGPCGATEILDPVNRRNEEISHGRCCNVAIQRGIPKKTLIGHSEVHGFGLYIGEDVKQHEFICEYRGELLNRIETEQRRGKIYEKQDVNYMFQLNMGKSYYILRLRHY